MLQNISRPKALTSNFLFRIYSIFCNNFDILFFLVRGERNLVESLKISETQKKCVSYSGSTNLERPSCIGGELQLHYLPYEIVDKIFGLLPLQATFQYRQVCYTWNSVLIEFIENRCQISLEIETDCPLFSKSQTYDPNLSLPFTSLKVNVYKISIHSFCKFIHTCTQPITKLVVTDHGRKMSDRWRRKDSKIRHMTTNIINLLQSPICSNITTLEFDLLHDLLCISRIAHFFSFAFSPGCKFNPTLPCLQNLEIFIRNPSETSLKSILGPVTPSLLVRVIESAYRTLTSLTLDFASNNPYKKFEIPWNAEIIEKLGQVSPKTNVNLGLNLYLNDTTTVNKLLQAVQNGLNIKGLKFIIHQSSRVQYVPACDTLFRAPSSQLETLDLRFDSICRQMPFRIPVMVKLEQFLLELYPYSKPMMKFREMHFPVLKMLKYYFRVFPLKLVSGVNSIFCNTTFTAVKKLVMCCPYVTIPQLEHCFPLLEEVVYDDLHFIEGRYLLREYFALPCLTVKRLCVNYKLCQGRMRNTRYNEWAIITRGQIRRRGSTLWRMRGAEKCVLHGNAKPFHVPCNASKSLEINNCPERLIKEVFYMAKTGNMCQIRTLIIKATDNLRNVPLNYEEEMKEYIRHVKFIRQ